MSPDPAADRSSRATLRPYHALALLPSLAVFVGTPFANRVHATLFGLPFLLAWIIGCVLLTALVMAVIGALDRRRGPSGPKPPPDEAA